MKILIHSLLALCCFTSLAAAQSVVRGPYLQNMTPTSVTVQWRTNVDTDSAVWYGPSTTNLINQVLSTNSGTDHIVTLTNLPPRSTHFYTVGTSSTPLVPANSGQVFTTSPTPGTPGDYRLWILGDSGRLGADAATVRDAFLNYAGTGTVDGIIMLGDNAYTDGTDPQFQNAMFVQYNGQLKKWPVWSTRGNHEKDAGVYYDIFTHPTQGEAGGVASGSEAYYSFDYGPLHLICLDSFGTDRSTNGAMMAWLKNDLLSTTQEWLVAFFHHPPYTKGSHDSDNPADSAGIHFDMRERFTPVLEEYGVDLVMGGHSHSYERSHLIHGHTGVSSTFDPESMMDDGGSGNKNFDHAYSKGSTTGTVYMVNGSSSHNTGAVTQHPVMYRWLQESGSVSLEVSTNELEAIFINAAGNITDRFQMQHQSGTAPTIQLNPTVAEGYDFLLVEADLVSTGTAATTVQVYYGDTPGSVIEAAWDEVLDLGIQSNGVIQATLPNLQPDSIVYYRFQARNSAGVRWSTGTGSGYVGDGKPVLLQPGSPPEPGGEATNHLMIAAQSDWKYSVTNGVPALDWTSPLYDDSGWSEGPARLGYGNDGEATVLDFGPDFKKKYITTYFRKTINNDLTAAVTAAVLKVQRDDGAIAYLNGLEVARFNMDPGPASHSTLAASTVNGPAETTFFAEGIDAAPVVPGTNVLAVEVHLSSASSTDLGFDAELEFFTGTAAIPLEGGQDISAFSARLDATLLSTGQAPVSVTAYWGTTDRQTAAGSWDDQLTLADVTEGPLSVLVTNLTPGTRYYYRYAASNSFGSVWAPHSGSFITTQAEPLLNFKTSQPGSTNLHPLLVLPRGADWNYQVTNAAVAADWNQPEFDDSSWSNGPAILGFGVLGVGAGAPIATVIGFGGNAQNVNRTTYFRTEFSVPPTNNLGALSLELLRDDGAVVYLNGQELVRDNMPAGAINYSTAASSGVGNANESTYFPFAVNSALLQEGTNLLAVEIHQINATSSDLGFDGSLTVVSNEVVYIDPVLLDVSTNSATLQVDLISTGGFATVLNLYYGLSDGGAPPGTWTNVYTGGYKLPGSHAFTLTNLIPATDYVIRFEASNAFDTTWTVPFSFSTVDPCNPDIADPVILDCPGNQELQLETNCSAILPDYRPLLLATDACSVVTLSQLPPPGTVLASVTNLPITLTAVDSAGNSSSCQFNVAVLDLTPPLAFCTNAVLQLNSNETAVLPPTLLDAGHTDTCSDVSSSLSQTQFGPLEVRTNLITVTVIDAAGLSATCMAEVVVLDRDGQIDSDLDGLVNGDDPDDDNDLMPDLYENANGLDRLNAADAQSDSDEDGMTALEEMIAGTLPGDANSALTVVIGGGLSNGVHILDWPSVTGRVYAVYAQTNLLSSNAWQLLTNNLPQGPYTNSRTDPRMYFRVAVTNALP